MVLKEETWGRSSEHFGNFAHISLKCGLPTLILVFFGTPKFVPKCPNDDDQLYTMAVIFLLSKKCPNPSPPTLACPANIWTVVRLVVSLCFVLHGEISEGVNLYIFNFFTYLVFLNQDNQLGKTDPFLRVVV